MRAGTVRIGGLHLPLGAAEKASLGQLRQKTVAEVVQAFANAGSYSLPLWLAVSGRRRSALDAVCASNLDSRRQSRPPNFHGVLIRCLTVHSPSSLFINGSHGIHPRLTFIYSYDGQNYGTTLVQGINVCLATERKGMAFESDRWESKRGLWTLHRMEGISESVITASSWVWRFWKSVAVLCVETQSDRPVVLLASGR